jgi:hypothetical protein
LTWGSGRIVGRSEIVLRIAEEQAACSSRPERKRDTFLPLLEHAIAYLNEFRVRFDVGLQILRGVGNRNFYAFEYLPDA